MFVYGVGETIQTAYQDYKEVSNEIVEDIASFIKEQKMGEEQILTLTISLGGLVFIIIVALIKGFLLSKRKFICSHCGKEFYPKWYQVMFETHFNDYFKIRCPHCDKKKYQKIIDEKM